MKQVLQNARTGAISVADVPVPRVLPGCVLVKIAASLVSAGTERAASEFASKGLLQKARSRPDLVREVIDKARRDGILAAASAVENRLRQPLAVGYSSAGVVLETGEGVSDLSPGDRVACAGANIAVHAEVACVPRLLAAKISSSDVDFESAAFTTLGAVAIHGVRTAEIALGEIVAVIGAGLLGQLTIQVLRAAGCRVIAMDPVRDRAELASRSGSLAVASAAAEFRDLCLAHSNGHGVDAVLITAETSSSDPVNLASEVVRDRGRVVAVGTVGMELQRKLYYEKEIDFRVSRSYGPGRYDAAYEQKGRDYNIGYVRWTETRNMEAFLSLLGEGKLNIRALVTHTFDIENASAAYDLITGKSGQPYLGVLIRYPEMQSSATGHRTSGARMELVSGSRNSSAVRVGMLGAGNFAQGVLLPVMKSVPGTQLVGLCAANAARSRSAGKQFKFVFCTTDEEEIYSDASINTVVIATRHHLHAKQVTRALEAGKHVFCEKPLCLTEEELAGVSRAYARAGSHLMVGFNRRFAPMAQQMKSFLGGAAGPLAMTYRINAGPILKDHWILDPEQGGGRILGEVCHFLDFLSFLCGAAPLEIEARSVSRASGEQDAIIVVEFADGSLGTISYVCNGDRAFSKERVEVFGGGYVAVLDDFRRLELVHHGRKRRFHSWLRQDKGHTAEWRAFAKCLQTGGPAPISFDEITASTLAAIRAAQSLRCGEKLQITDNRAVVTPLVS